MKVQVDILNDNGTVKRSATYDAPPGTEVGDMGLVNFGNYEWAATYTARVSSLTPDYDGPCKEFRPVAGMKAAAS